MVSLILWISKQNKSPNFGAFGLMVKLEPKLVHLGQLHGDGFAIIGLADFDGQII